MKQSLLLRNICCFYTRSCLSHHHRIIPKTQPNSSLYESTRSRLLRLYSSSEFDSVSISLPQTQKKSTDAEDVSTEELRKLIDRYYGGDQEVIPSIFEAILKRKLAGKYEKEDEELMQELMQGRPSDGFQDKELGSNSDELSDTDEEESD